MWIWETGSLGLKKMDKLVPMDTSSSSGHCCNDFAREMANKIISVLEENSRIRMEMDKVRKEREEEVGKAKCEASKAKEKLIRLEKVKDMILEGKERLEKENMDLREEVQALFEKIQELESKKKGSKRLDGDGAETEREASSTEKQQQLVKEEMMSEDEGSNLDAGNKTGGNNNIVHDDAAIDALLDNTRVTSTPIKTSPPPSPPSERSPSPPLLSPKKTTPGGSKKRIEINPAVRIPKDTSVFGPLSGMAVTKALKSGLICKLCRIEPNKIKHLAACLEKKGFKAKFYRYTIFVLVHKSIFTTFSDAQFARRVFSRRSLSASTSSPTTTTTSAAQIAAKSTRRGSASRSTSATAASVRGSTLWRRSRPRHRPTTTGSPCKMSRFQTIPPSVVSPGCQCPRSWTPG